MDGTWFDRKRFLPHPPGRSTPPSTVRLAGAAGLVALCLAASPLGAGSIFMKNGYIIQGPIVEHSEGIDGSIVMGWPNGKVTIYRRFIERVDFEPGEEKNAKIVEASVTAIPDEIIITPAVEEELPQSLSEMVRIVHLPQSLIEGPVSLPPSSGEGGAAKDPSGEASAGTEPIAEASSVPNPADGGAETGGSAATPAAGTEGAPAATKVSEPRWGFALEPPAGWKLTEVKGCVSWSGKAGPEGFAPSVNIASVPAGSLTWDEACQALRKHQTEAVKDYQFITEEKLEVGGRPAYRVTGSGLPVRPGSLSKPVAVRQAIVENEGKFWLISTFSMPDAPEDLSAILERTVRSVEFKG